ncbi:MAG: GNAT family N-acetyltransferase [Rubrivivax sp.]
MTLAPDRSVEEPSGASSFRWVPIRSLSARQRPRIVNHLLALSASDRYLRFGYAASDAQLTHYADLIDFDHDEVFGIFDRRLRVLAMAHLAQLPLRKDSPVREAEFGVSVLERARGRGYGTRLFEHAVLHARNRHIDTLVVHAMSENRPMLSIARRAGASVVREGSDALARLQLPPDDWISRVDEMVESHAGDLDYRLKRQARRVARLFEAIGEVKRRYRPAPWVARE